MRRDEHTRAEQQGDGQPENEREIADRSGGAAASGRSDAELPESGMGGTSDAGTAADDAAEAAAYNRGLPNDLTQQTGRSATDLEQDL